MNLHTLFVFPWKGASFVLFLVIGFASIWRLERRRMRIAREAFLRGHQERSDRDFLAEAGAKPGEEEFFLAARHLISKQIHVAPGLVHAEDTIRTLLDLQFDNGYLQDFVVDLMDLVDANLPLENPPDDQRFGDYLRFLLERRS
jgi:hypothetical protein